MGTMLVRLIGFAATWLALCSSLVNAHGSHGSEADPSGDWATWHMQGEFQSHHLIDLGQRETNDLGYRGTSHRSLRCSLFLHPPRLRLLRGLDARRDSKDLRTERRVE